MPLLVDVLVYVIRFPFLFCNERKEASRAWGGQWERDPGPWQRMGTQPVSGEPVNCSPCSALLQGPVITETIGEWALSPAKGEKALLIYYISMLGDWPRWEESLLL